MRKSVFLALAFVALGFMAVGIYSRKGSAQAMNLRHHVHDLPEHGLVIIAPTDAAFDAEMSALLGRADESLNLNVMAVRPFCAFVKNEGEQEVVAYKLKWELTDAGGQVKKRYSSFLNPSKLLGEELPAGADAGTGIRPHAARFVAWDSALESILSADQNSRRGLAPEATQNRAVILSRVVTAIGQQTAEVAGVTVSIDGAFFADGSFVGPDTDDTFAEVSGYVEAKRELARVAEAKEREGKSAAEIVEHLKSFYRDADDSHGAAYSPAGAKKFFLGVHVNELLRAREATGAEHTVARMLLSLRAERVNLHRKVK